MSVTIMPTEQHRFYVAFELRPVEDRDATILAGHPVYVDQEVVKITMPGGSLVVDKVVTKELLSEWKHGKPGFKPPSPFALAAYEAWKEGNEAPVNGMDLKNWPGITPAQLKMCHGVNIRTVEDLSQANDDALRKMGMGAVALKNKAATYLENAVDNKASEQVSALNVRLEALEAALSDALEKNAALEADLGETPKKKPGRPRKAQND